MKFLSRRRKLFPEIEIQILKNLTKTLRVKHDYLEINSNSIAPKSERENFTYEDLFSPTFPVKKEVFHDWIHRNQSKVSFESIQTELGVNLITLQQFENLEEKWSVFYSYTRPGFVESLGQALVQVTAYCTAGPPNFGTIYLLERQERTWEVSGTFGLYNQ